MCSQHVVTAGPDASAEGSAVGNTPAHMNHMPRSDASSSGAAAGISHPGSAQGKGRGQNPRGGRTRGRGGANSPAANPPVQIPHILQPPPRLNSFTVCNTHMCRHAPYCYFTTCSCAVCCCFTPLFKCVLCFPNTDCLSLFQRISALLLFRLALHSKTGEHSPLPMELAVKMLTHRTLAAPGVVKAHICMCCFVCHQCSGLACTKYCFLWTLRLTLPPPAAVQAAFVQPCPQRGFACPCDSCCLP